VTPPTSVRERVLLNAALPRPLSPGELAAQFGVRVETVHQAMSRKRAAGRLRPSERQFSRSAGRGRTERDTAPDNEGTRPVLATAAPVANDSAQLDPLDTRSLLAGLEHEGVLDGDERRKVLSRLARRAPDPVKVAAVRGLEEMDRQHGRQVGPPEPSTDAEMTERLATLVIACGAVIAERAFALARAEWLNERRPSYYIEHHPPANDTAASPPRAPDGMKAN
jgi:hypothetical protein